MKIQRTSIRRWLPLLVVLAVLVATVAIATPALAAYVKKTEEKGSEYTPAEASDPSFQLDADNAQMENVYVTVEDKGYPVYVRAAIVITWQGPEEDDVYFAFPQPDTDYSMALGSGWVKSGSFYYYTSPVVGGGTTTALIQSFVLKSDAALPEEGCVLSVEISVQTVQAIGYTDKDENGNETPAWQDAWKNAPYSSTAAGN